MPEPQVVKDMTCFICAAAARAEPLDTDESQRIQEALPPGARIVHQKFLDELTQKVRDLYEEKGRLERALRRATEREER